jgi:hypothetical protein
MLITRTNQNMLEYTITCMWRSWQYTGLKIYVFINFWRTYNNIENAKPQNFYWSLMETPFVFYLAMFWHLSSDTNTFKFRRLHHIEEKVKSFFKSSLWDLTFSQVMATPIYIQMVIIRKVKLFPNLLFEICYNFMSFFGWNRYRKLFNVFNK